MTEGRGPPSREGLEERDPNLRLTDKPLVLPGKWEQTTGPEQNTSSHLCLAWPSIPAVSFPPLPLSHLWTQRHSDMIHSHWQLWPMSKPNSACTTEPSHLPSHLAVAASQGTPAGPCPSGTPCGRQAPPPSKPLSPLCLSPFQPHGETFQHRHTREKRNHSKGGAGMEANQLTLGRDSVPHSEGPLHIRGL